LAERAPPQGFRRSSRGKDAGSADTGGIGATEDAASRRSGAARRHGVCFAKPSWLSISASAARRGGGVRQKEAQVKVMALIYGDASRWDSLSESEREAVYARYGAFEEEARKAGVAQGGAELASTRDATTVRVRDEETLVTDGPYAEVKEALGGYYVFEVETIDEALDFAAKIPGAETGAIEVRPLYVDQSEPQL
jgi:hypothetical protein